MDGLGEFVRNWWIKTQLKAPAPLQRTVVPRLHEAKELSRLLAKPYLPVYRLQGGEGDDSLTVMYVGLDFAKPFLRDLIYPDTPTEERVGRIPFWHYNQLASLSGGDIIIVEAAQHLIRKLSRQNAIVLPPYVHHILDVRGDWQEVRLRLHRTIRKHELRLVRKYGYRYEISHHSAVFAEFYHQAYLPTMHSRHSELSSPMPIRVARQYFRHGWLFRIMRGDEWVSGVVCHPQQDILVADIAGVRDGNPQLIKEGAASAIYYATIHWANQHGYWGVNFLGSGIPRLDGGLFRHKRKWGTAISVPPHLHRRIWIKVQRVTCAVSRLLQDHPFVVMDEDGELHGLFVVDDLQSVSEKTIRQWEKQYVTPGMSSLRIRSISYFDGGSANGPDSDLVIPLEPGVDPEADNDP